MTSITPSPGTPDLTPIQERLVALSDGRPGLRGMLPVHSRASSPGSPDGAPTLPVIDFIASSETLDRYGEIILASGWRLENYRRNPVFQNGHQYGDVLFTLGKALITEVRSGPVPTPGSASAPQPLRGQDEPPTASKTICQIANRKSKIENSNRSPSSYLFQRVQFATDANPAAKIAYSLYRDRFLNAVSVGFIPLRWEEGGPEAGFRRRYLEQELLEVSAVGLPANPDALQLAVRAGALHKSDLEDLLDFLRSFCSRGSGHVPSSEAHTAAESRTGVPALPSFETGWLRLARELSRILRAA
jgi:Caudovirus prohead serine protease